jgi:hypothetical protein
MHVASGLRSGGLRSGRLSREGVSLEAQGLVVGEAAIAAKPGDGGLVAGCE